MTQQLETPITRCPDCLTLVYEKARTCHSCGAHLRNWRTKVFTRRAWWAIGIAVVLFALGDVFWLLHEKRNLYRDDLRHVEFFLETALREYKKHPVPDVERQNDLRLLARDWRFTEEKAELQTQTAAQLDGMLKFFEEFGVGDSWSADVADFVRIKPDIPHELRSRLKERDARSYEFVVEFEDDFLHMLRSKGVVHGRVCISSDDERRIHCIALWKNDPGADRSWCSERSMLRR